MTSPTSDGASTILRALESATALCTRAGRDDLATVLQTARVRIERPDTVIAVVGEFKQGKSSLVNGLLGEVVCPVDDDIATACLTVLRYGPARTAQVHVRKGDADELVSVPVEELGAHIVESRSAKLALGLAEVELPNAFLRGGITLVDTPGVGSLNPGYMAMTLAYVRSADALLFVSDASAPLTATELDFLGRVRERCPVVVTVVPKTDLYPDWRVVLDLSAAELERLHMTRPLPISNALRMIALDRGRADLNDRSGYPELVSTLERDVVEPAAAISSRRAADDLERALSQVELSARAETEALTNSEEAQERLEALNHARERFDHLRSNGSRWATVMNDGFADLVADVEHRFRGSLRQVTREAEEQIESIDPAKRWETLTADVRERVARTAETMVLDLEQGSQRIAEEILALLREEDVDVAGLAGRTAQPDVAALWLGKDINTPSLAAAAGTGYAGLRGAQGGILVFGMLANLAGIALSTMALAGIGIIFGGKQLLEDRKRQVTGRRQQARTTIRQFLDDVQFQVSKDMRDLSRELQRRLRDHFGTRIAEMTRTYAEAADSLQKSLRQTEAERDARRKELASLTGEVERIMAAVQGAARS